MIILVFHKVNDLLLPSLQANNLPHYYFMDAIGGMRLLGQRQRICELDIPLCSIFEWMAGGMSLCLDRCCICSRTLFSRVPFR